MVSLPLPAGPAPHQMGSAAARATCEQINKSASLEGPRTNRLTNTPAGMFRPTEPNELTMPYVFLFTFVLGAAQCSSGNSKKAKADKRVALAPTGVPSQIHWKPKPNRAPSHGFGTFGDENAFTELHPLVTDLRHLPRGHGRLATEH